MAVSNEDIYLDLGGASGGGSVEFNPIDSTPTTIQPIDGASIADYLVNYEIIFISNLQNEVGDLLKLTYEIVSGDTVITTDTLTLADFNTDAKQILKSNTTNSKLNLYIDNKSLPANYKVLNIAYANRQIAEKNKTDLTKWAIGTNSISVPATELLTGGFAVSVMMEKQINVAKPITSISTTKYDYNVKISDSDTVVKIPFNSSNADFVDFYLASDKKIRVESTKGFIELSFKKDFEGVYGSKKIIVVPYSNLYGTGDETDIIVNFNSVNDFPSITSITFPETIDVPAFSDLNIEYNVEWTSFAVSSVDIELIAKDKSRISLFKSLPSNGSVKINLRQLSDKFPNWNGNDNVTLILKPYNNSGSSPLTGNEYEIKSSLLLPTINLDEDIIKKSLFDAFVENIKFSEPEKESKYLTHLANFGNDEQLLISSWEEDNFTLSEKGQDALGNTIVTKEVESLILKLYSPLPANITENSTFWITKLLTNPLIETVVLNQQDELECPPIKGPNFNIDIDFTKGQSTNYESLDELILNAPVSSSANLVAQYLSSSIINTDELNIEYVSGSTYLWDNFVHFSSAKERVDNFVYKVQLIETYEQLILSSSTDFTGEGSAFYTSSISSINDVERNRIKKEQLIQGFDGFDKFLYTSSSMSWPYSGNNRLNSSNTSVTSWYNDIIDLATTYDIENANNVKNNIPSYIVNNDENEDLLLFLSMIGHHFDNIYFHTKAIERSRGLGYKSKNVSDKLLYDILKSFNWDAKNLSADSQLWKYLFGQDSNGNTVEVNPAKQRTYEVWRRIANNIPYLLKHKGTRRGVYALLACYGVPASNLSILEFGGPEVTDNNKTKLEFDNITTALSLISGSYVELNWQNTERSRKPDTIELFVKPAYSSEFTLISGSGWDVKISGSLNDNFGIVSLNISSSTTLQTLSSNRVPIFNGNFFGIEVSRTTGSGSDVTMSLNLRQSNRERTIFQSTLSLTISSSNWESGSTIKLGGNYSGSVDEFRLWSTPLDTERFFEHVSFPEMINGNHTSSSTDDLYFRLDFEYPKNLNVFSTLPNVDTNIYFSGSLTRNDYESGSNAPLYSMNESPLLSASIYYPTSITEYPYQFEVIDRSVLLEIPSIGSNRYSTNKVRFESQELLQDLSPKNRATKKAFDQSPTDSNRIGLFFSPTKELNIDIAKSLGGINLDNYIGDPSDRYKSNYKRLDELRKYYFKRFDNRDIYAYINLIKLYEKSMFEDIKKMLPARVKATTGLLIEPHILERSKIQQNKPTGDDYQQDVTIHYEDTTITTAENNQYETIIDSNLSENLVGENNQLDTTITDTTIENIVAENYQYSGLYEYLDEADINAENYQYDVVIEAGLEDPTILTELDIYDLNTIVGQTDYESIGFGIYGQDGYAIRTYFDKNGRRVKERIKVDIIKEEKRRSVTKYKVVIDGKGDPRGGFELTSSVYTETKLNIQPFESASVINVGTGDIVEVKPLSGYLPTHYRNTTDLTRGLQNSFFRGSKNTAATTLDGTSPVEVFVSNPNTLTVNRTGRNTSEPILEVE